MLRLVHQQRSRAVRLLRQAHQVSSTPNIDDGLGASKTMPERPQRGKPMTVDRELPDPFQTLRRRRVQFLVFAGVMVGILAAIFNYEKTTAPIITATFYRLRRLPAALALLGDNIGYADIVPWISGELNQMEGRINVRVNVKGSKNSGVLVLRGARETPGLLFTVLEWKVVVGDQVCDLLAEGEDATLM